MQLKFKRRALRERDGGLEGSVCDLRKENLVGLRIQAECLGSNCVINEITSEISDQQDSTCICTGVGGRQSPSRYVSYKTTCPNDEKDDGKKVAGSLCRKFGFEATQKGGKKVGKEEGKGEERDRGGEPCKGYHKNALYRNKEVRNSVAN